MTDNAFVTAYSKPDFMALLEGICTELDVGWRFQREASDVMDVDTDDDNDYQEAAVRRPSRARPLSRSAARIRSTSRSTKSRRGRDTDDDHASTTSHHVDTAPSAPPTSDDENDGGLHDQDSDFDIPSLDGSEIGDIGSSSDPDEAKDNSDADEPPQRVNAREDEENASDDEDQEQVAGDDVAEYRPRSLQSIVASGGSSSMMAVYYNTVSVSPPHTRHDTDFGAAM